MDCCQERMDLSLHTSAESERRVWHFNVAFIGSCRVGKTKLLQRFVDSQFSDIYSQTVETSFVSKSVTIGRHHVVFQCWDTPGSSRSAGCLDARLAQLHAIFIVFDGSRDAVADLEHWHHVAVSAECSISVKPLLVLVANKTDLGSHEDSMTRARDFSRASGGLVFAYSVLTDEENLEVDAMMLEVGKALTERHAREAAVANAAAAAAASTVLAGDRVKAPPPSLLPPPPQPPTPAPQSLPQSRSAAPSDGRESEGDGGTQAGGAGAAVATGDGRDCEAKGGHSKEVGGGGGGKGWWSRASNAICCCYCW